MMKVEYRHEAVPYEGHEHFVSCCTAVATQAGADDRQLLFLVSEAKTAVLRDSLGNRYGDVAYLPTDDRGRNPAQLISLLDGFRTAALGRPCVGVNEPLLAGLSADAVDEARFGESVLNAASLQSWPMSVLCLYDAVDLDAAAMVQMRRSHPAVSGQDENLAYEPGLAGTLFAEALPDAPAVSADHPVRERNLGSAREFVRSRAHELTPDRREDLVLAANEVVTNSLQHGGGSCEMAMWDDATSVVCEVRDDGQITDPFVGRFAPAQDATAGRGLWLANHLCDLVQIRSSQAGTTVRLHMNR